MKPSRRILLKRTGLAALGMAAAPWLARSAAAQAKATKQAMQYQDHPKNAQQCSTCMQFVPGAKPDADGTCKVVDGPISPKGWCVAYVKKA
jgi:hypothetical protein